MIKVALKHWIYEACIEQLFNGIFKNFNSPFNSPPKNYEMKIGDWFHVIKLMEGHRISSFIGCRIEDIYKSYFIFKFSAWNIFTPTGDFISSVDVPAGGACYKIYFGSDYILEYND